MSDMRRLIQIIEEVNMYGEEPLWFDANTGTVEEPYGDHMQAILEDPELFGVDDIDLDDPSQPFMDAYANGWVRVRSCPKYHEAGVETDDIRKARKAVAWIMQNKPEMLTMKFRVEIRSRTAPTHTFIIDEITAEPFAKRGIIPR